MIVTLKEIVDGFPALREVSQLAIPPKTAFLLGRAMRECAKEVALFDEQWNALLQKYGEPKPDDPSKFNIKDEHRASFERESREFMSTQVALNIEPIKTPEFADVQLKPAWVADLYWLFEDDQSLV